MSWLIFLKLLGLLLGMFYTPVVVIKGFRGDSVSYLQIVFMMVGYFLFLVVQFNLYK